MPTYTYINETTEEEFEVVVSWDEFQELLKSDPNFRQTFTPLKIAYRPPGVKNTGPRYADSWKEKLRGIKKQYPGSTINADPS